MYNSTTVINMTTVKPDDLIADRPYLSAITLFLYVIISIIGIFGNAMVLFVVVKYSAMRTTINIFIAALSVSNLVISLLGIPFTLVSIFLVDWSLGSVLCHLLPFTVTLPVLVSAFVSVAIAVDRFVIIIYPHKQQMSRQLQVIILSFITLASVTISLPTGIYSQVTRIKGALKCLEDLPDQKSQDAYGALLTALQVVVPAIIQAICYGAISIKLHRRVKNTSLTKHECKQKEETKRNKRINRMLIAMVVIFYTCWIPTYLFDFLNSFIADPGLWISIFFACHILGMSSVIYNPFLYGWMNENFKRHFRKSLHCVKSRKHGADQLTTLETYTDHTVQPIVEPTAHSVLEPESHKPLIINSKPNLEEAIDSK